MILKRILWRSFSYLPSLTQGDWVVILCYHSIGEGDPSLSVSSQAFRAQINDIRHQGIKFLSLEEMIDVARGKVLPGRGVLLTFDDGYWDFQEAADYLKGEGIPCVLAVTGAAIAGFRPVGLDIGARLLSSEDIARIAGRDIAILPHGMSHRPLTGLSREALQEEICGSRDLVEKVCGVRPQSFVYPFGIYDEMVEAEVTAAGFKSALTTDWGLVRGGTNVRRLPRQTVNSFTDPAFFRLLISSGLPHYLKLKALRQYRYKEK